MRGLAVGNVSGSAVPEVVASADGHTQDAGSVVVLQQSGTRPSTVTDHKLVTASSAGVPGDDQEYFGSSPALGDIDHDRYADLVVGAEGADDFRGRVVIVHGAGTATRRPATSCSTRTPRASPAAEPLTGCSGWSARP